MTAHTLSASLDPGEPGVRSDAKHLADQIVGDSPLESMLRTMLNEVAGGSHFVVLRADEEITPAQAAEVLGVTRQFVDRLCESGGLPFRRLPGSRHRRIRALDVARLGAERESRRSGAEAIRRALAE
ncbi:MAG: helix-turn-helix domain-containing protein [Tetrasphaera jenkinsii]|jgi:excisionase family DNA binding protein|uniref:Regulatory protein MerR n=1 Tax=Nostocoides jenkinsii Ben 74 TaxID=1193518 RepID=A0A077M6Y6_9MICO|nr:helix-turn-helix domain-containing protein [Tetrasphaera jenkinsii]MCI1261359.1 helix-turn-helix domain-containing protein [Tetrasphaera jenkinsii]CCI52329.1 Regulatory protein MerR [Tetrasphaera jenkinsii Ben 74]